MSVQSGRDWGPGGGAGRRRAGWSSGRVNPDRREAALAPVLVLTALITAVISSQGAPLIPSIADQLHVPLDTAQWSLTATLLVGAVSAPIIGRLGDGSRRRETLMAGLGAVTVGGVVAALAPNLGVLVVGRALQGIGLALVPLTMAAARDHLPPARVAGTIALLSVRAAAGVGAGYPISGLIADGFGLSGAFWFSAAFGGVALLCVAVVVPASTPRASAGLDLVGAVLLTSGLVALLLAVAEGNAWGWGSAAILGLMAGAVVLLVAWVYQQLHVRGPLIELRLLRHPTVLTADCCAMVLGVAMYLYLSEVTEFVQVPRANGYGFSASVVVAGLCLVPFSILSFSASRALPWLTARVGFRALLSIGSLVVAAGGAFFALFHGSLWQAFAMMAHRGSRPGPDLRRPPRPDRRVHPPGRDRERHRVLPSDPLRGLLPRQCPRRVHPGRAHPGRADPTDGVRLHPGPVGRGGLLHRRRRPHLGALEAERTLAHHRAAAGLPRHHRVDPSETGSGEWLLWHHGPDTRRPATNR